MNKVTERWIRAGTILAADPTAKVLCPQCGDGYLEVSDEVGDRTGGFDRYLRCPICDATEVLVRMSKRL